uniref:AT-hook-containing transcription factor n=1 Tax=Scophthalmus maximus TaxID=52904 RepID=A0A8D3AUV9_SCOMX
MMSSVKEQTEEARQREEETPSESDEYLDMTEEEEEDDGEEEGKRETQEQTGTSEELGAANDSTWSFLNREETERNRSASASALPHILHFTAEEIASAPGIEAEAFPETGFTESYSSHANLSSSPRRPPSRSETQQLLELPEQVTAKSYSGAWDGHQKQPGRSQGKTRPSTPEAATRSGIPSLVRADALKFRRSPDGEPRTRAAEGNESRNLPLTYSTPDFSKVEPRVRFPKGGYKPPASKRDSSLGSPDPSAAFKSPADAVKEVLLNCPVLTVPQEIRCCQEAIRLIEQLQEEYNILLTKYAESENTIDRLRLGARVNLYSEPPKPGYLVQSGLNRNASKVMTLDRAPPQRAEFNSTQRAEVNTASLQPNGLDAHQSLDVGQQLAKILYGQADQFLQQLQTFDDLLRRKTLKPSEQVKRLSQLAEGLNSLERGYLFARDEHKLLQQRGEHVSHFDRERELEGLIFQCGLHMDELKEQVEQTRREQPSCEAPPTPPPQPSPPSVPSPSSVPSEGGGTLTHPQSPPVPLLVDPGMAAELEVSSASEEGVEETDDEETLNSLYLKPLSVKQTRFEDFSMSMDHYGSFQELPRTFDHGLREGALLFTQPGDEETERWTQRSGNVGVQKGLPQRRAESDHRDPPVGINAQQSSRSSLPPSRGPGPSTLLPAHRPSSHRRLEGVKSHSSSSQSSLGEIPASERRNSQLHTGGRRAPPQDGIITPETDSGFVCSESSRLTPAAAPSPVHQRASQRVLAQQDGSAGRLHTDPVSAASPASSLSHRRTAAEIRASRPVSPDQSSRSRQRQRTRTVSCSPQPRVSWTELPRVDGGARLTESDSTHTVSDEEQRDHYTESVNSHHSSHLSSSSTAPRHHGNSLREAANHHDTVRTLQAEVTRLTERLDSRLRHETPLRSVRASPSVQQNYTHHLTSTPRVRPQERRPRDVSRRRRARRRFDEDECILRQTAREQSPSVDRKPPQRDVFTGSEVELPTPKPRSRTSRRTKTTTVASGSCFSHTTPVRSKRSHSRQHPVVSIQVSNAPDEPDSGNHQDPVLCPKCSLRRSERPVGGNSQSTPSSSSSCRHCPLCGRLESHRVTEPDSHEDSDSSTHTSRQTAESPDRTASSRHAPTSSRPSPPPPQCMLVSPPLLMYSVPVHVSPSNNAGTSPGVRGHREARGWTSGSMDDSLNRAIRAARKMKRTSGHMAHSLASGLQYQDQLTQSCRY